MSRTALTCCALAGGSASMRSRGFTPEGAMLDLELEHAPSARTHNTGKIRERGFIPAILSPRHPFALQHRFERLLRFLRQMIGLVLCGILSRDHIATKCLYRVADQRGRIAITAHEFGGRG